MLVHGSVEHEGELLGVLDDPGSVAPGALGPDGGDELVGKDLVDDELCGLDVSFHGGLEDSPEDILELAWGDFLGERI